MAIAIPLIMGAMEVSATVIALTSAAVAVTGIGAKINNAAAKVFGKDLVGIANIAGGLYMGFGNMGGGGASGGASGGGSASFGGLEAIDAAGGVGGAAETASAMNLANASGGAADAMSGGAFGGLEALDTAKAAAGAAYEVAPGAMGGDYGGAQYGAPSAAPDAGAMGGDVNGAQYQSGPPPANNVTTGRPNGVLKEAAGAAPGQASTAATNLGVPEGIKKLGADAVKWFEGLDPRSRAALIQAGGQMVAGAAAGYQRSKELQTVREDRERYTSGSGMRLKPRKPATVFGGG